MRFLLICLMLSGPLAAQERAAGDFDYYVLSLSWSPNWCARTGDARGADQCDRGSGHGWILHGLWPQFDRGYPAFCDTQHRPPRAQAAAGMADIMASEGLARHQWKKHGTCTGLDAKDYFTKSRRAYDSIRRPEVFRRLPNPVKLPASVVEEAFIKDNPQLDKNAITITCRQGQIEEVRICLDRGLAPRRCTGDVARDCTLDKALFAPLR